MTLHLVFSMFQLGFDVVTQKVDVVTQKVDVATLIFFFFFFSVHFTSLNVATLNFGISLLLTDVTTLVS